MRIPMLLLVAALAAAAPARAAVAPAVPKPVVIPTGEDAAAWKAQPADGVSLALASDAGARGKALRLDFDFHGGGGYAVAHRAVSLDLPANYRFTFRLRGACEPNNLEFKLVDASGDNVWWDNQRNLEFPPAGAEMRIKKRQISFAWGPLGGGEPHHVAALEFAVTAGKGGKGSVWIEDLKLEPLPVPDTSRWVPVASASSNARDARLAVDADAATAWASSAKDLTPALTLDLGAEREFGGLVIDWASGRHARDYVVELSSDARTWTVGHAVSGSNGGRDYVYLPESEARWVRVRTLRAASDAGVAVTRVEVKPLEWSATPNQFFAAIAQDAPRGSYPRAMLGENVFWTVVGQDFDSDEALIDEVGRIEVGRGAYSIEPFLRSGGRLATWNDVQTSCSLRGGYLPMPTVRWEWGNDLRLSVTAFGIGNAGHSAVIARYRLENLTDQVRRDTLYLALRPFQVNPPTQFLSTQGGVATIRELAQDGRVVHVNGDRGVTSLQDPTAFGTAAFDQGDIVDYLRAGQLPVAARMPDPFGHASGALAYVLDLQPHGSQEVALILPLHEPPTERAFRGRSLGALSYVAALDSLAEQQWRARQDRVGIQLPDSDVVDALKAQLAWVLINRNGPAIQPGTRSYARSWIRDGCLTSSALLRLGETEAVRQFIEWFVPNQYPSGKAPCCVDQRGADPVPEHDSSGELIYLIAEYHRYTGDNAFAEQMWPHVLAAAQYLDTLRAQRRTPEWRTPENARFFGILPPSISHEGYSAKPMHSYWDDLFALRGFKDAVYLAGVLGKPERAALERDRDEFAHDLGASIRATMAEKKIDYMPGCADLGDFDPTSTSIAFDPVMADSTVVPRAVLERTFEKYWDFFSKRRDRIEDWDAFTPYEWRNVGAMAHLGWNWRDRANQALNWFMQFRRPLGFQHWAEVVWHDERAPHFIGDMPHTWCGTDYVRSILDMLAYEDESDSSLVIAGGIPESWLDSTMVVKGLRTRWGSLSYRIRPEGRGVVVEIDKTDLRVPPGGIRVPCPYENVVLMGVNPSLKHQGEGPYTAYTWCVRSLPAQVHFGPIPQQGGGLKAMYR